MAWRLRPDMRITLATGPAGAVTSMATARATSAPRAFTTSPPKTRSSGVGNMAVSRYSGHITAVCQPATTFSSAEASSRSPFASRPLMRGPVTCIRAWAA